MHTDEDKLREVERLIEEERRHRGVRNSILAAVASDVRAAMAGAAGEAERELERRLSAARRSEQRPMAMIGAAEELMGRWPAVRAALRRRALSRDEEVKAAARAIWDEIAGDCSCDCRWESPGRSAGVARGCSCQLEAVDLAMVAVEAIDRARLAAAELMEETT